MKCQTMSLMVLLGSLCWCAWGAEYPTTIKRTNERIDAIETRVAGVEKELGEVRGQITLSIDEEQKGRKPCLFELKEWRVSVITVIMGLLLGAIVVFWVRLQKDAPDNKKNHYLEMGIGLAIFLLIMLGAYQFMTRVLETGLRANVDKIACSSDKSEAVLEAYNQLSSEMAYWFTLLGIFGAFLGLILPVGAHFLQIKAVDRHEAEVKNAINGKVGMAQEHMKELVAAQNKEIEEKMERMFNNITARLSQVWQQHGLYAKISITQCVKKIILAWNKKNYDEGLVRELLLNCWMLLECAIFIQSEEYMLEVTKTFLETFSKLKKDLVTVEGWKTLSNAVKMVNKSRPLGIYLPQKRFSKDEDMKKICQFIEELGIQPVSELSVLRRFFESTE